MEVMPDRLTVARLMAIVAVVAILLGAGLYWWEHNDVEQAMVTADIQMIARGDAARREAAAYGLGATSRGNPARIAGLLTLTVLGDPEPKVRQAAVNSLPRVLTRWARANLPAPTPGVATRVFPPLGGTDAEAAAIRGFLRALNDPQARVRLAAAEAWGQIQNSVQLAAELDAESGPALDRLLMRPDSDAATRMAAVWDLSRLQTRTLAGRNRMLGVLRADPDPNVQNLAVQAIMKGWPPQVDLYPILLARIQSPLILGHQEVWLLLDLPPPPPEAVPALLELLEAGGDRAAVAASVLGKRGPAGRAYLSKIKQVAESEIQAEDRVWVICRVVQALVAIDPDSPEAQEMLGPIFRLLQMARSSYERIQFEDCLASYGAAAAPVVTDLVPLLKGSEAERHIALRLLGAIGPPALPVLQGMLASSHEPDRTAAARGLLGLGLNAVGAIPDLEAAALRQPNAAIDETLRYLRPLSAR